MLTLPRDHVSPSQVGLYLRCGEAYRLSYVQGIKIPPAARMVTGTGVHEGASARHTVRLQRDEEMPRRDVIDYSVSKFDERLDEDGIAEEDGRGKDQVVGEARDKTATLASGFCDLIAPQVMHPIAVEDKAELEIASLGVKLVNITDVVNAPEGPEFVVLEDLKCGSKLHGQAEVDASLQLTWNALGWQKTGGNGRMPHRVGLRSLRELAAGPKQDLVTSTRTEGDVVRLLRIIDNVCRSISAGVFPPASDMGWWCSPKQCGYWRMCRYRGGK
jgi:hypothetical protein